MVILLSVLTILVTAFIIIIHAVPEFRYFTPYSKWRAVSIAKEHLAQKYTQTMIFQKIIAPFTDGLPPYYITFYPKSNPELTFMVWVEQNLELRNPPDNYYSRYFTLELEKILEPEVKNIWGEDASLSIPTHWPPLDFDEQTSLSEMNQAFEYNFSIKAGQPLDKSAEPARILEMIEYLKPTTYHPDIITMWYLIDGDKMGRFLDFENWMEIKDTDEVAEIINENWRY